MSKWEHLDSINFQGLSMLAVDRESMGFDLVNKDLINNSVVF